MMIRLLPTFLNENLGRVSCADNFIQPVIATVKRSRMDFFIISITKKGLDSFVIGCKDRGVGEKTLED
jgi:hypothetical protein